MPLPEGTGLLEELEIHEVSLVDNPANPEAKLTIFKVDADELEQLRMQLLEATKGRLAEKLKDAVTFMEIEDAFYSTMHEARKRAGDPPRTKLEETMTDLEKAEAARKEAEEKLTAATAKIDELTKAGEKTAAEVAELKKKLEPEPEPEPIPAHIQKQLDSETEARKAAEARIEKMEDENSRREAIAKAESEYPGAGAPAELGALVHGIRKLDPERADKLEEHFRAVHERIKKGGLFLVKGHDGVAGDRGSASDDPAEVVAAKVAALRKDNDKLSEADAQAKVFKAEPALYEAYRAGRSVAVGSAQNVS